MAWTISARLLDGNLAVELRHFLRDHGVRFEERRACDMVELIVRLSRADALRLADALQLIATKALFDGDESCLITVRPGGRGES
jgi:hypothetical protein